MTSIDLELTEGWRRPSGIFLIALVEGALGQRIAEIQRRYDPKLANTLPPHLTLVGSSGVGPIVPDTSVNELQQRLIPICQSTEPLILPLEVPHRFMQTNIVVVPLAPHGPLRVLFDKIATSGLRFGSTKHRFTPHITLSFYRTLEPSHVRELLALRFEEAFELRALRCSLTNDPMPPRTLLDLPLGAPTHD